LPPGLGTTTAHIGTSLLLNGARTTSRHIGNHHLVHQRLIKILTEGDISQIDLGSGIRNLKFHN
jgi:hypothetical protein